MDIFVNLTCLSRPAPVQRPSCQAILMRLLLLGLLLIAGTVRGQAQTITAFTTQVTFVNGARQYIGHITLSSLHSVYVGGTSVGHLSGGHWISVATPVTLSSANPALAQPPASVTVGTGSLSVSFPIPTTPVSSDTLVPITATCFNSSLTANLIVQTPGLSSLTLSSPISTSYTASTGSVVLDSPAPAPGITLAIGNSDPYDVNMPTSVTIPTGATTVTFPIAVGQITTNTGTNLSATLRGSTQIVFLRLVTSLPFDFNRGGHNDLLVQNSVTGDVGVWFMNGATVLGGSFFNVHLGPEWSAVGTIANIGGMENNPFSELVFQNTTDGRVLVDLFSGANLISSFETTQVPAAGYKVVGTGSFNGDSALDLVFQNQSTHQIAIWLMSGNYVSAGVLLPVVPAAGWNVVGVGDFNHDGQPDLLFQNTVTGQLAVWSLNGTSVMGSSLLSAVPPPGWQVKGVADYNNDGMPDLVLQNTTTHQAQIWFMNGLTVIGSALTSAPLSAPYQIVGPH